MTDDFLIILQHKGYLLMVLMVSVCTAIKTGNPLLFKERCQIRSELLQFRRREGAMSKFRDVKTLQKFASVHASIHNHFNLERHLNRRETFKENRTAALAE